MQIFGDSRRLALGAFILAGLLLIGLNAAWLTRLLNPSLPLNSPAVKTAAAQWHAYQAAEERRVRREAAAGVWLANWPIPESRRPNRQQHSAPAAGFNALLPTVSGIVEITQAGRSPRTLALIGGGLRGERDQVSGFTIERITAAGVELGLDGRRWFAPAPQVPFSVDRGN